MARAVIVEMLSLRVVNKVAALLGLAARRADTVTPSLATVHLCLFARWLRRSFAMLMLLQFRILVIR